MLIPFADFLKYLDGKIPAKPGKIKIYLLGTSVLKVETTTYPDRENQGKIPMPLARVLSDDSSMRILKSASSESKSAYELSRDCEVSLTTVYRQIKRLNNKKLLDVSGSIDGNGKKHFAYRSKETVYCKCACSYIDIKHLIKQEND